MDKAPIYPAGYTRAVRAITRRLEEVYRRLGPDITAEIAAKALVLVDESIAQECEYLEAFAKPRKSRQRIAH